MEECSQRKWEHSPIPFEMGKYSECSTMLDVVYAEKNVEGTFQVSGNCLKMWRVLEIFRVQNYTGICNLRKMPVGMQTNCAKNC